MRWLVVAVVGAAVMAPVPGGAASFGSVAGLVEAARDEVMGAETVARRRYGVTRIRSGSRTRSPMRVSRAPHFTRHYRAGYAPRSARW